MKTSFAVNDIKKSLIIPCIARGYSSTKQWTEALFQNCATILLKHNPTCSEACWRRGGGGDTPSGGKRGTVQKLDKMEKNNFLKRDHPSVCIFRETYRPKSRKHLKRKGNIIILCA